MQTAGGGLCKRIKLFLGNKNAQSKTRRLYFDATIPHFVFSFIHARKGRAPRKIDLKTTLP